MAFKQSSELVQNRAARHHYEILETYEAGLVLKGTEVKSLRDNGGTLQDSYVKLKGEELWLVGAHIAPYRFGNLQNHEEKRERKLLMHRQEINRLRAAMQIKGYTLVPLALYLKAGRVKLKLAKAKGLKAYDKRDKLKTREQKRAIEREIKEY